MSARLNTISRVLLQGVANRDIKLENTLLDGSPRPLLKICDFGYSKVPSAALISCSASHYCALHSVHIFSKCFDITQRPVLDADQRPCCCSMRNSNQRLAPE